MRRRHLSVSVLSLVSVFFCTIPRIHSEEPAKPDKGTCLGIVFVLDGSGRLRLMADDLACVVAEACLPLDVQEYNWSHGCGRIVADLRSKCNHHSQGQILADRIQEYRTAHPTGKVYVVTHSAGVSVALAAAVCLPPRSVERFIFLAPAVSPDCDLTVAQVASCSGVDVFCSKKDMIGRCLAVMGCSDGHYVVAACTKGLTSCSAENCPNLYQHCYTSELSKCGHHGGHYGWTRCGALRECVLPLLSEGPTAPVDSSTKEPRTK
jgi:hypothetical protein